MKTKNNDRDLCKESFVVGNGMMNIPEGRKSSEPKQSHHGQ
jgi:hypothetical protein